MPPRKPVKKPLTKKRRDITGYVPKRGINHLAMEHDLAKKANMADKLAAKLNQDADNAPHMVIIARAGCGKTTTLEGGVSNLRGDVFRLTPSDQQRAIWDALALSRGAKIVCLTSFGNAIVRELEKRVGQVCEVMTLHSMGYRAVRQSFSLMPGKAAINKGQKRNVRTFNILGELLGVDPWELLKDRPNFVSAVETLVGLCKQTLLRTDLLSEAETEAGLDALAAHYAVDMNGDRQDVFTMVPRVLARSMDVAKDRYIDFNDMIWLPIVLDLGLPRYDILMVDESQDLNRCQQEIALRVGKRVVVCGDPQQAIYGFAGADTESMNRMSTFLQATDRNCQTFYLTETRRCGKAVVAEAQKIVPDFSAHVDNPEGEVAQAKITTYHETVHDGDMVLCRVNAPLVSECFKFIKMGRKANIRGRDVGTNLVATVKKMKASDAADLVGKLSDWYEGECKKEAAKKNASEARLINLEDRYQCLLCFCEGLDVQTVEDVIRKIETIFSDDDTKGILLSSIHKAKGLESENVFFLRHDKAPCPHPMAKSAWQREQELNLLYVGITRAIRKLTFVGN